MSPFPRTVLGAALDWHAICAVAFAPPRMMMRDAVDGIIMNAQIHKSPTKIKMAAWRAYVRVTDPARAVLLMIIESSNPLKLVELMLEEMNDMPTTKQREKPTGLSAKDKNLLALAAFRRVTALLGMSSSDPLENAVERVQELLDCQARSSALEARVAELTAQIATGHPKAAESAVQLGRRLHGEGKSITDLWACATAAGADFKQVMAGFVEATAGAV